MNQAWHARNPLPKHASLEERIDWHRRHAENCGCRPMPADMRARLENPGSQASSKKEKA